MKRLGRKFSDFFLLAPARYAGNAKDNHGVFEIHARNPIKLPTSREPSFLPSPAGHDEQLEIRCSKRVAMQSVRDKRISAMLRFVPNAKSTRFAAFKHASAPHKDQEN